MNKTTGWYERFCYYLGLDGPISDILWRQKQRLGWLWWLGALLTIAFTLALLGFQIWLLFHVIFYRSAKRLFKKLFKRPEKDKWQWLFFKMSGHLWQKKKIYKAPDPDYYLDEEEPWILPRWLGYLIFWVKEVD